MKFIHRKNIIYPTVFISVLLLSLIAHLPASFVIKHLPPIKGLTLINPQGSIWKGSLSQLNWQNYNYGELTWDIQLSQLFRAKFEALLQLKRASNLDISGKGFVGIGFDGLYARQLIASLPASRLAPWIKTPIPITLNGQLELTLQQAHYATPWCHSAQGSLVWNNGLLGLPVGELDLGTVIVDLECEQSKLSASGQQQTDQISSAFSAKLTPIDQTATTFVNKGTYNIQMWFKPEAKFPASMHSHLGWLGNADNQGRYQFNYQGKF